MENKDMEVWVVTGEKNEEVSLTFIAGSPTKALEHIRAMKDFVGIIEQQTGSFPNRTDGFLVTARFNTDQSEHDIKFRGIPCEVIE
jgi:anti-sigma-K factor RskA